MKNLLLTVAMVVAGCGSKSTVPPVSAPSSDPVAGSAAGSGEAPVDECRANCANEGPMDDTGHFIYGANSDTEWTAVPADEQKKQCDAYCSRE